MTFMARVAGHFGYVKAQMDTQTPGWMLDSSSQARWTIPDGALAENQAELYQRLSWLQAAVQALAQTAAGVPFNVKRRVGERTVDIPNHPFERLLGRPNPLHSRFELLEATFAYRALAGNAYWWLNRSGPAAVPQEIWVLPAHLVKPVPDGRMYLKGYMYDEKHLLEPWEVVHFKRFHPLNGFVGLSPVEALATVAVGDLKMQEWNTNLFAKDNAKVPGALAYADPINDVDWEVLKKQLIHDNGGTRRGLLMLRNVGRGGVQWLNMGNTQKEMEFLQGRSFNKEEIYNLIAPGLASVLDVNSTMANATTGKAAFLEFAVWPALSAVAEKISNDLLPCYDRRAANGAHVGMFDDVRITDRSLQLQEIASYGQFHSVDETREKFWGDGPVSGLRTEG
ncbi:MAG: phage portal protein [Herpetosiphonaceae bacterium]|nr:phage portal protein [Herpetosiphonaceae bacterium]